MLANIKSIVLNSCISSKLIYMLCYLNFLQLDINMGFVANLNVINRSVECLYRKVIL